MVNITRFTAPVAEPWGPILTPIALPGGVFEKAVNAKKGGWIQGAIKHPGRMTRAAERAGESTHAYMEQHKNDKGSTGKAARLGLTLSAMHKR